VKLADRIQPLAFSSIRGQSNAIGLLKAILSDPSSAPRSIIIHGGPGYGKTTIARIFARALNCTNGTSNDCCSVCESCSSSIDSAPYYKDFNPMFSVNALANMVSGAPEGSKRVIVIDCLNRSVNQDHVVRMLDEYYSKVFFVFTSNDISCLHDRIRARSVEICLDKPTLKDVCLVLKGANVTDITGVAPSNDLIFKIACASNGDYNKAITSLCMFTVTGDIAQLRNSLTDNEHLIVDLMSKYEDEVEYSNALAHLTALSLDMLRDNFFSVVLKMVNNKVGVGSQPDYIKSFVESHNKIIFDLVKFSGKDWVVNSFANHMSFVSVMWALRELLLSSKSTSSSVVSMDKFKKKIES